MKPIKFKESNVTLSKPDDMTDKECGPLPVFRKINEITSCWKMSLKERISAVLFGKIWIHVYSRTHPPILPECKKTVFVKRD